MIIEFIFSTSNYLQKKKKTSNYDNLSNDYQKYIYICIYIYTKKMQFITLTYLCFHANIIKIEVIVHMTLKKKVKKRVQCNFFFFFWRIQCKLS